MAYTKETIVIPNALYGDRTVTAYSAGGLAAYKARDRWLLVHAASGGLIGRNAERRTRAGVYAIIEALRKTPVDWTKSFDEIRSEVQMHYEAVDRALSVANGA